MPPRSQRLNAVAPYFLYLSLHLHHALLLYRSGNNLEVLLDNSLGTFSLQIESKKNQNNIVNQCPIESH